MAEMDFMDEEAVELSLEERLRVDRLFEELCSGAALLHFASDLQTMAARQTDELLDISAKTLETDIGDCLSRLTKLMGRMGLTAVEKFVLRKPYDRGRRLFEKYQRCRISLDRLVGELDRSRIRAAKSAAALERVYEENVRCQRELQLCILAGLRAAVPGGASLGDVKALERRIHDLRISRTLSMQVAAQIRIIQENERQMAEKIQTSIIAVVPLWKTKLAMLMSLKCQAEDAMETQAAIVDAATDVMKIYARAVREHEILRTKTL